MPTGPSALERRASGGVPAPSKQHRNSRGGSSGMRSVKLATIVITAAASLFAAAQLKAQVVQTSIPLTFQPGPIAVDPGLNQIYFGTYYGAKQLTILNG